jgi:hypothetical protein
MKIVKKFQKNKRTFILQSTTSYDENYSNKEFAGRKFAHYDVYDYCGKDMNPSSYHYIRSVHVDHGASEDVIWDKFAYGC